MVMMVVVMVTATAATAFLTVFVIMGMMVVMMFMMTTATAATFFTVFVIMVMMVVMMFVMTTATTAAFFIVFMMMVLMATAAATAAFAMIVVMMVMMAATTATTATATTAVVLRRTDRIEDHVNHFEFQTDHAQNLSDGRIVQDHECIFGLSHRNAAVKQCQSGFGTQFLITVDLQHVFNSRIDHIKTTLLVDQHFAHLQNAILLDGHFDRFFTDRNRCGQLATLSRRQSDVSGTFQNHFGRRGLSGQNLGDLHDTFPFYSKILDVLIECGR
jgi:hypothetical protein